jgi:hypothetical protein
MRRWFVASMLAAGTVVIALAAQPVTLVMQSGERISGQLSYKGRGDVTLEVNGQSRDIPFSQIAIVAFVSGDPLAAELNQLPQNDSAPELERHLLVMRDGSVVHGKLYKFSPDGSVVTIDPREGGAGARRDIPASQIARLYLGPGARSVYNNVLSAPAAVPRQAPTPAPAPTPGTASGAIIVNGNQRWTDTGITVSRGDRVSFNASGQIRVAAGNAPETIASPDGSANYQGSRANYPVPTMPVGALIGSVGTGTPFAIGSNRQPITMPAAGRLYLGVNDDGLSDNSGAFTVTVIR